MPSWWRSVAYVSAVSATAGPQARVGRDGAEAGVGRAPGPQEAPQEGGAKRGRGLSLKAPQTRSSTCKPQGHAIFTFTRHGTSSHFVPAWHEASHLWLQCTLGAPHNCTHSPQSPAWQDVAQPWPQASARPQGRPHEMAPMWQRWCFISRCPPTHSLDTSSQHKGCSPKWHWAAHVCPQANSAAQGRLQVGGLVPHTTGGSMAANPQEQVRGSLDTMRHGGQRPK
mmetsp:Transcript_29296/g.83285  ORF Transcript_29296/g.83285 Transcript_29296/m.83285 type:complete len:225 (-) Transcript_29296:1306-1980(-)